jgi:site-specific DNA-methyltransferase (adenine-specific)
LNDKTLGSLELNRVYQMDCLEGMKNLLPDESIDLVVTDPPYKIVQGGCTNNAVSLKGASNLKNGEVFKNNTIRFADWIPELYRILKNDSHCYIMVNDRNMFELLDESKKAGFKLLNILTWKKSKHAPNRYYLKNSEFIVFLRKGRAKNINDMGTFSVLEVDNVKHKTHPVEKPVDLMKILVKNSSQENDIVLDPFAGSGSTLVACRNLDRKFIGFETEREYIEISNQRLESDFEETDDNKILSEN